MFDVTLVEVAESGAVDVVNRKPFSFENFKSTSKICVTIIIRGLLLPQNRPRDTADAYIHRCD